MTIKHAFNNPKADGGDATIARPSDWNADHVITSDVSLPANLALAGTGSRVLLHPTAGAVEDRTLFQQSSGNTTIGAIPGSAGTVAALQVYGENVAASGWHYGDIRATSGFIQITSASLDSTGAAGGSAPAAWPLQFLVNGISHVVNTSGEWGVRCTPQTWGAAWDGVLQLGLGASFGSYNSSGSCYFAANAYHNGGWKYNITGNGASLIEMNGAGTMVFYAAPAGTAGGAITFTGRMLMTPNGMTYGYAGAPVTLPAGWYQHYLGPSATMLFETTTGATKWVGLAQNAEYSATGWHYLNTDLAAGLKLTGGTAVFLYAASGTAAAGLTWSTALNINGTGVLSAVPLGYLTGAGIGAASTLQGTSKSTTIALNALCGTLAMNGALLAAAGIVSFTVSNTYAGATDVVVIQHESGGTLGAYTVSANTMAASSFKVTVRNNTAGSLSEALVLRFAIIKASVT